MNAKITFPEIVDLIAESTSTTKRVCELFLRELFATVSQSLIDGEDVKIKGVGTFKVTRVKPRKSVSVNTGGSIEISGHKKLTFTPDKSLSEAVNQPFAQFETVFLDDAVTDEKLAAIDKEYPSLFDEVEKDEPVQETPKTESTPEAPEPEPQQETPVAEPEPEAPEPEVEPEAPKADATSEPQKTEEPHAVEPAHAEPVSRPMLVGIPIDGPTQPKPEPEPVEEPVKDEYFYRPAPRNAYTPTAEQLAAMSRKVDKRWIGVAVGVLACCLLCWLLMKGCGKAESGAGSGTDSDTVALAIEEPMDEPATVTETVTDQNVLSTMAAKHYGSQWFWVYIYEENKDKIANPDNVPIGTVVVIPPAEKYGIDAHDQASLKKAQRRSWEILKGK
ncbi:MAG: HU family DNA-binding protein [Muribaculaceae bacterium]|nr:HU family DNA-binding protein [Muribaculaceae bacterium]